MTKDEALKQALEALENATTYGSLTGADWVFDQVEKAITAIKQALAAPVQQTCNCRWDGEVQVQQCTLHEAHLLAVHEWAGRAKAAEAKLAAQPAPVPLNPMQPIVDVNGVTRFKKNGLVDALHEHGVKTGLGLNELHCMNFSDEDRMQFAQLIGYSLSGYGDLSYVSDASYDAAQEAAHGITASPEKGQP